MILFGALFIIFFIPKGFNVPYIKDVSVTKIFIMILFICVYIIWSNYYLRKMEVKGEQCIYVNMFGRKKEFRLDSIEKIVVKNDTIVLYDNNGIKICKLEANMDNMEEFQEYVYIKKGIFVKCKKDEIKNKVEQSYLDFTEYLKCFFSDKESLGIVLEYGFQIEEKENVLFYILKFRAKDEKGYLAQNFLKIGYWEYQILFIAYKKDRQIVLYCEKEKLDYYIEKLYRKLVRKNKRKNIVKKSSIISYEMMEQFSV